MSGITGSGIGFSVIRTVIGFGWVMILLTACSTRVPLSDVPANPSSRSAKVTPTLKRSEAPPYPVPPSTMESTHPNLERRYPQVRKLQPASPAVLVLMTQADRSQSLDQLDTAVATLERALRIQSRNAELWSRLAKIRLQQQQLPLAENLAKKSNTLAAGIPAIKARNWAMIAEIKKRQGDAAAATRADKKAIYYKKLAAG